MTQRAAFWISIISAVISLAMFALVMLLARTGRAEHNHDHHRFHAFYQNWVNKDGKGCCNDRDCRTIADRDVLEVGGVTVVRIEGELCPVLTKHYLVKGNSPNWDSAHICVLPKDGNNLSPCERLLCFQPKPLS